MARVRIPTLQSARTQRGVSPHCIGNCESFDGVTIVEERKTELYFVMTCPSVYIGTQTLMRL